VSSRGRADASRQRRAHEHVTDDDVMAWRGNEVGDPAAQESACADVSRVISAALKILGTTVVPAIPDHHRYFTRQISAPESWLFTEASRRPDLISSTPRYSPPPPPRPRPLVVVVERVVDDWFGGDTA
jgi:hypothetical protein